VSNNFALCKNWDSRGTITITMLWDVTRCSLVGEHQTPLPWRRQRVPSSCWYTMMQTHGLTSLPFRHYKQATHSWPTAAPIHVYELFKGNTRSNCGKLGLSFEYLNTNSYEWFFLFCIKNLVFREFKQLPLYRFKIHHTKQSNIVSCFISLHINVTDTTAKKGCMLLYNLYFLYKLSVSNFLINYYNSNWPSHTAGKLELTRYTD
jgi:hypothetical protein